MNSVYTIAGFDIVFELLSMQYCRAARLTTVAQGIRQGWHGSGRDILNLETGLNPVRFKRISSGRVHGSNYLFIFYFFFDWAYCHQPVTPDFSSQSLLATSH